MITLGNDISKWQGDINFDVFKNNTQFVICKATEGVGYTDTKFSRNRDEARRVGLTLGFYHFARPDLGNSPEKEADYFLGVLGQLRQGELLALDYECPNQTQAHVDWCKKWLDRVQAATNVKPLIYLNQSQMKFNWKVVVDGGYGLWLASYTFDPNNNVGNTGNWPSMAMQQWSNNQTVPGASGGIDGNVFFGSLDNLKKYGYQVIAEPLPTPCAQLIDSYEKQLAENKLKIAENAVTISQYQVDIESGKRERETLILENQTLSKQVDYYKPYKALYEKALTQIPNSMTGIQLIQAGLQKLLSGK